jgi:hypothetical protein
VCWALEEVGQPYEVRFVSFSAMKEAAHRALHPFGQIPTYEEGKIALRPNYSGYHMSKPQVFYGVLIGTAPYEIVWLTELKTAVTAL